MIERINTKHFHICSNHVLVRVSPDYDFVEWSDGKGGKVEIQLPYYSENKAEYQSITGTVVAMPEDLLYHRSLKTEIKGITIATDEYEAMMRQSLQWDVPMACEVGDKIVFDYKQGLSAETDGRLLQDESGEYLMMLRYDAIFGVIVGNMVRPVNGWVFFIRDQKPSEYLSDGGVWVVEKVNKYGIQKATIVAADTPVVGYIEAGLDEPQEALYPGDRILLQKGFGYRIACDMHAGKMEGWECIHRKNIHAILADTVPVT